MKKQAIITCGLVLLKFFCQSQIAFYDAMSIRNNCVNVTGNTFAFKTDSISVKLLSSYLRNYIPASAQQNNALTQAQILLQFNENPFFGSQIVTVAGGGEGADIAGMLTSMAGGIGGLDVTNIADGFAKFLVKRSKQELNVAFFTKFKEQIAKDEFKDFRTVFPQTYKALNAIGDEIYNYERYLQTLRECFEKDLASLITNAPKIAENHKEFFKQQPELEALLLSAFYIGQQLQDKQHPADIIENYPDYYWKKSNANYRASIQTLKILSGSLRSTNSDKGWISSKELKGLCDNREGFLIYMGLIYQEIQNDSIKFGRIRLDSLINVSYALIVNNLPIYKNYVKNFVLQAEKLDNKLIGLNGTKSDSLLLENYYSFFTSTIDLFKYANIIEELPFFPKLNLKTKSDKYLDAAQTCADLVIDVNRRNYSSGIMNVFELYSDIFKNDNTEFAFARIKNKNDSLQIIHSTTLVDLIKKQKEFDKETNFVNRQSLAKTIDVLEQSLEPYYEAHGEWLQSENINTTLNIIFRYGTFMATIVEAKNSDEVVNAIEVFALPSGSARIKRETPFNVSFNAYVGLFAGGEKIKGVDASYKFNSYGVTAPIGVAISQGLGGGWSLSEFISVVDLGTVTAFRFGNDSTSTIPTIQLKDIISPGFFISVGFPKSPLSLNVGYQVGPLLRTVTQKQNTYDQSYSRISISLCVDIPVFNFYTKSKK